MAGQLSYTQSMWVRFPQLRFCFSCVTVAQLICNQPVVGSIPIFGLHNGSLPEWLKGTDCKSVGLRLPWFETTTAHATNRPMV